MAAETDATQHRTEHPGAHHSGAAADRAGESEAGESEAGESEAGESEAGESEAGESEAEDRGPAQQSVTQHSAMCGRLMQILPRITRGMRRSQDRAAPESVTPLGPRHVAALEHLRDTPLSVGCLAARLGLTMSTVSGVLADLDRAGYIERRTDAGDRRRTFVEIIPGKKAEIRQWLDNAAQPMARVLERLDPAEQAAFLKAMDMLETELRDCG